MLTVVHCPFSLATAHQACSSRVTLCVLYVCVWMCSRKPSVFLHGALIKEYFSAFFCQLFISYGTTTETSKPRGETGVGRKINTETVDWTVDVQIHLKT